MSNKKRIELLSDNEVKSLYELPKFNDEERYQYFNFSDDELCLVDAYGDLNTRVTMAIQLGYFKAKQQFFTLDKNIMTDDFNFVCSKILGIKSDPNITIAGYKTLKKQQAKILKHFDYIDWSEAIENSVVNHTCYLLKYYPKKQNAFRQLLLYFDNNNIVIPGYRKFQDVFSLAISQENKRLNEIVASIPSSILSKLQTLINKNSEELDLNSFRVDQRDFQYTAVKEEIEKAIRIKPLYEYSKQFIPKLGLSSNAITYYSDVVSKFSAFRLRKLKHDQQLLYLICHIHCKYKQVMDNLILTFIYHVRTILDLAKNYADLKLMEYSSSMVVDFPKLAEFLRWFPNRSKNLTYDEVNESAYGILPENQFNSLAKYLNGNKFDKKSARWEYILKSSRTIALYLRPIFLNVDFIDNKEDSKIYELMSILKHHYANSNSPSALKMQDDLGLTIPQDMLPYLKRKRSDQHIDPILFEFYVYKRMVYYINRGRVYCNDSVSYCDLDYDLIDVSIVNDAEEILNKFGYPDILNYCGTRLDKALAHLDDTWQHVVDKIDNEDNDSIQLSIDANGNKSWSLRYESAAPIEEQFFSKIPKTEIIDILIFIGKHTNVWDGFTHIKSLYIKREKAKDHELCAAILAEALGVSIETMTEMSDLNYNKLHAVKEDYLRVETLCAANDIITNFIASLPIFAQWNIIDHKLLADADGQKHYASDTTIQSRFSTKYFGRGKGISLYTLVANHVAVNSKSIGLNEYEGHCLFDMVYGNKTDVSIDMVTGDNHSKNKCNYMVLDAIGIEYVPSIKNIRKAADDLYSSTQLMFNNSYIVPKGQIDSSKIRGQEKQITRVLLSLIMQENTQTNIIRKLSSHTRYSRLNAAIHEYNKIFHSTHVLKLIDSMQFRKALRTARNRTESYHQLQGLTRKLYNGIFKGKTATSNRVGAHATRLLSNCIIAYNSLILNSVYERMLKTKTPQDELDNFLRVSPIAWTHILLTGQYNFTKRKNKIDIAVILSDLERASMNSEQGVS